MSALLFDTAIGDKVIYRGTFTLNGATPVAVPNVPLGPNATFEFGLKTVGGSVGAVPAVQTVTPSTETGAAQGGPGVPPYNGSFTVAGTAGDTSTYNFRIFN